MTATPEQVAHYEAMATEARIVTGTVECPFCGPTEHDGSTEDEAHCPCVEWDVDDWIIAPDCKCPCHEER